MMEFEKNKEQEDNAKRQLGDHATWKCSAVRGYHVY